MEREYQFVFALTKEEYDSMITGLRRLARERPWSSWATWVRDEFMKQMSEHGENPDPPRFPNYSGHTDEAKP